MEEQILEPEQDSLTGKFEEKGQQRKNAKNRKSR